MNESKVKVIIGESINAVREELVAFMDGKIAINISYLHLPDETHKIVLVYKETPEFIEVEDVELETMREIYMSYYEKNIKKI